jgi:two-component system CheB/CheR fusion protein
VVDENLHVLQYRGDTGPYLKAPPGPPTTELLLLAREGLLGDLRDTLDRARRDRTPARKDGVRVKTNGHFSDIELEVIPLADPVSGVEHLVVLFVETSSGEGQTPVPHPRKLPTTEEESEKDREISRLDRDLVSTRAYLQSVIEQKEATNEELRAANEEVVSANEELQSTNEELTTAKEELQSTNEELTTVNDELQNRIRTANRLADDMVNLIETTRIPIVVLGPELCVRQFTPAAQAVMNLRPGDIGRPFLEIKAKINVPDLEELVHNVIDTLEIIEREITDETGTWYKLYVRPYKTLDHKVGGVVVMLIDIDTVKRHEREIERSRNYAVGIVETVREPLVILDADLRVRAANRSFYDHFRLTAADTVGRLVYELGDGQWNIPALRTLLEEILPQNSHFENFEVTHLFRTIGERTMLFNAHRVKDASEQLILLAIEDLTARKRAERLRKESEDRLRTMVDTTEDAIITIDENGSINSVNAAAERMFGYSANEMIGQNVKMLMPAPYHDEHDGYLERYRRTGEKHIIGIGREVRGRRKDGAIFPLDLAVSGFSDHGVTFYTGILRDLSVRKTLEAEVLQVATLEQQRIGQELHDTVAQELTALGLFAQALVESLKPGSSAEGRVAAKIADGVERTLSQVRDISQGLIRVEVDPEGLTSALTELVERTTERHDVTCTFECPVPVSVEDNQMATQLYCIAREAVTNALKHSRARNITIRLEVEHNSVSLRVHDDGIGFAEPLPDARGMGLKIMRYRAEIIGGHLSVAPAEPAGVAITCTCIKGVRHDQKRKQDK